MLRTDQHLPFSADGRVEEICTTPNNVGRDQALQTTQLDDGFAEPQKPLNFNKPLKQVISSPQAINPNKPLDFPIFISGASLFPVLGC